MIGLFYIIAGCTVIGGVLLFFAGFLVRSRGYQEQKSNSSSASAHIATLNGEITVLNGEIAALKNQLDDALDNRETVALGRNNDEQKDEEIARLSSMLAKVEGENDRAQLEIDNLRDELKSLKARKREKPKLPPPTRIGDRPATESEAVDDMAAKLDMERVAHQRTREELESVKRELGQVKKVAAARMAGSSGSETGMGSGGARFKTMAIGMRSPAAGETSGSADILRHALEKVQAEKERVEAELERAKKENQILKMRK